MKPDDLIALLTQPKNAWLIVVLSLAGTLFSVLSFMRRNSVALSHLEQWAQNNGYSLLEQKPVWLMPLRVFPLVSRSQKVYRIKVRDNQGEILAGWARVGGWWFGLFSNTVVVKWDSELVPGKPLVPGVPIDCPKWLEKWAVPPPDPALEETY